MNTAESLRLELANDYADFKSGVISAKQAAERANIAGKIIQSAQAQVMYYALRQEVPTISFLESSDLPRAVLAPIKRRNSITSSIESPKTPSPKVRPTSGVRRTKA